MLRRLMFGFMVAALLLSAGLGAAQGSRGMITTDSASQLDELMRLGRGSAEFARFTSDGSTLVVGGTAGVWLYDASDLATESEPPLLATDRVVTAIAISPDDSTVAVSVWRGNVALWDIAGQSQSTEIDPSNSNYDSYGTGNIAYSPDGSTLALNFGWRGIMLYDLDSSTEQLLEGDFRSEAEVVFSPDGQWLAGTGSDNSVYLWDVNAITEGVTLSGHTRPPTSISFNADGSLIVTGAPDETIRLWNSIDGSEIASISGADNELVGSIRRVTFSPQGDMFASGDFDGNIVLWDATDQTPHATMTAGGAINDLAFSPDGSQLVSVSGDQYVQLWDTDSGSEIAAAEGHMPSTSAVTFSPDSSTLAFSDYDDNLWLWDTVSMPELNLTTRIEGGGDTNSRNTIRVAFASDGTVLASADTFNVRLYDAASHQLVHELRGHGSVEGLAFSPDDTLLAFISTSALYVFDVSTGELLASLDAHNDWLNSIAWSPDQTLIATSSIDHTVRVYGIP